MLSASAINIKDISKELLDNLNKNAQEKLIDKNITDHERYILSHKIDIIKNIRV